MFYKRLDASDASWQKYKDTRSLPIQSTLQVITRHLNNLAPKTNNWFYQLSATAMAFN